VTATRRTLTIVAAVLAIAVAGYAAAAFWPRDPGEAVSVADTIQLGDPPTHNWPTMIVCPRSLHSRCGGKSLTLFGTVNMPPYPTGFSAVTIGSSIQIVCAWPVTAPDACRAMGSNGATLKAESAVYGVTQE
jgi:hypothetical protein